MQPFSHVALSNINKNIATVVLGYHLFNGFAVGKKNPCCPRNSFSNVGKYFDLRTM